MPFTHKVDSPNGGNYATPVLLQREPVDAGLPTQSHFIWKETRIQHHDNYHPHVIGTLHPDGLGDPIDPLSSSGTQIYDLSSGGGRSLYLINERVLNRVGPLVVFIREYSALPFDWEERQFGWHTFPGRKARKTTVNDDGTFNRSLIIASHPKTLPCLIESKFSYRLGAPTSLLSFNVPTYYTYGSGFDGTNVVEYTGWSYDEDGEIVSVTKRGGGTTQRPIISNRVTRWKGEIHQIEVQRVVSTIR